METFVTGGERQTPVPTSSTVPSELPSPLGLPSMIPSLHPTISTSIQVKIKFDNNATQTGWYITSENGNRIIERLPGYYTGNDTLTITESVNLDDAAGNYTFTILDSDGNGLCCNEGVGFYSINANDGQLIFGEGQFGYLHNETFSVGYLHTEEMTATSKSAPMLRGRGQGQKSSSYHPNRQRKHAQSIESES